MKKLIFLLLAVIPVLAFSQKAKIEFENTSHNFGTISETGGKASYLFIFKNTGATPLILTNVKAGCGCTTPEWSREPIAPGQSGNIKVSYDPRNRPGSFVKSVTVNSNAENSVISLTIRGNVSKKPADPYAAYTYPIGKVKAVASNINLGSIGNMEVIEKNIEIINSDDKPATVTVTSPVKYITATITPPTLAKGQQGTINIRYDAKQKNDWGFVTDKLSVSVNNTEKADIAIVANINEDFSNYKTSGYENAPIAQFIETEAMLGDIAKNTTVNHEFYIQNNGKSDLIIRKFKTSDNSVAVHMAKSTIKPGKKAKITLNLKTDENPGKKIKLVQFTLNDPQNPVISYKVTGNVL